MKTKSCTRCTESKPVADFPAYPACRDGLSSWCRTCHLARTRQWRAEHGEAYNQRRRRRAAELRAARIAEGEVEIAEIMARDTRRPKP
jgi:hypothetical protein